VRRHKRGRGQPCRGAHAPRAQGRAAGPACEGVWCRAARRSMHRRLQPGVVPAACMCSACAQGPHGEGHARGPRAAGCAPPPQHVPAATVCVCVCVRACRCAPTCAH
jgi:hypothetical protein